MLSPFFMVFRSLLGSQYLIKFLHEIKISYSKVFQLEITNQFNGICVFLQYLTSSPFHRFPGKKIDNSQKLSN